jgi:hypothetical protein
MESQDTGKLVEQKLKALLAEKQAQNPFIPHRHLHLQLHQVRMQSPPVAVCPGLMGRLLQLKPIEPHRRFLPLAI